MENLCGTYSETLVGKRKFHTFRPHLIPSFESCAFNAETIQKMGEAERLLGSIAGVSSLVSTPQYYLYNLLIKEAHASCSIDSDVDAFIDTLKSFSKGNREKKVGATVKSYVDTLNHGITRLYKKEGEFNLEMIEQLHTMYSGMTESSRKQKSGFRTKQTWLGDGPISKAKYLPPNVEDMRDALTHFEKFLQARTDHPMLVKLAIIHAHLLCIHPFESKNGIIGRMLIPLYGFREHLVDKPLMNLSSYFLEHKEAYFEALQDYHNKGDYNTWVRFFLDAFISTSRTTLQLLFGLQKLHNITEAKVRTIGKAKKSAMNLYHGLYKTPIIHLRDAMEYTRLTKPNATILIQKYVDAGILKQLSNKQRNRFYIFEEYISLLLT